MLVEVAIYSATPFMHTAMSRDRRVSFSILISTNASRWCVILFDIWCMWEHRNVTYRSKEEPASWAKEMMGICCCFCQLVYHNVHMLPWVLCYHYQRYSSIVFTATSSSFSSSLPNKYTTKKQVMTAWPFCDSPRWPSIPGGRSRGRWGASRIPANIFSGLQECHLLALSNL